MYFVHLRSSDGFHFVTLPYFFSHPSTAPYAGVELISVRRHEQSYLSFSGDKQLILVRCAYEEQPTREPLILKVPNELLSQIFAIAIAYDQNKFN